MAVGAGSAEQHFGRCFGSMKFSRSSMLLLMERIGRKVGRSSCDSFSIPCLPARFVMVILISNSLKQAFRKAPKIASIAIKSCLLTVVLQKVCSRKTSIWCGVRRRNGCSTRWPEGSRPGGRPEKRSFVFDRGLPAEDPHRTFRFPRGARLSLAQGIHSLIPAHAVGPGWKMPMGPG
jgi:hypothetical protein